MANSNLTQAKRAKNDEFYTQYSDIEKEMNAYVEYNPDVFRGKTILLPCDDPEWSNFTKFFAQNFEQFGIKKLISTSYAVDSKNQLRADEEKLPFQPTLLESSSPQFDTDKTHSRGKLFILDSDQTGDGVVDVDDLQWNYLEGDGDFRSAEVCALRDESDIIITNPPFSLFREFLMWVNEASAKYVIIGNMNSITYKEVFPLIKKNKLWLGNGFTAGNAYFQVPNAREYAQGVYDEKTDLVKFRNCVWFSTLDHGRRHKPLPLMTMDDNRKFNKKVIASDTAYLKYDNYDAIEIPFTNAIPSDYVGVMGVPISFLDKYNPEQFEIIKFRHGDDEKDLRLADGSCPFFRILIKHK